MTNSSPFTSLPLAFLSLSPLHLLTYPRPLLTVLHSQGDSRFSPFTLPPSRYLSATPLSRLTSPYPYISLLHPLAFYAPCEIGRDVMIPSSTLPQSKYLSAMFLPPSLYPLLFLILCTPPGTWKRQEVTPGSSHFLSFRIHIPLITSLSLLLSPSPLISPLLSSSCKLQAEGGRVAKILSLSSPSIQTLFNHAFLYHYLCRPSLLSVCKLEAEAGRDAQIPPFSLPPSNYPLITPLPLLLSSPLSPSISAPTRP